MRTECLLWCKDYRISHRGTKYANASGFHSGRHSLPDGGSSSYRGKEPGSTYQAARDAQKIFCIGRISGSSSIVPAGTTTALPLCVSQGSEEPHLRQKQVPLKQCEIVRAALQVGCKGATREFPATAAVAVLEDAGLASHLHGIADFSTEAVSGDTLLRHAVIPDRLLL